MKTALLCRASGRKYVHIHLVCDTVASGSHSPSVYILELLPAFNACPALAGLTLHANRTAFEHCWSNLVENDSLSQSTFNEHQEVYRKRQENGVVQDFIQRRCCDYSDLITDFEETGYVPKLHAMPECALDVQHLKSAYPEKTFWVAVHPPSRHAKRDASLAEWFKFVESACDTLPDVRFILLGHLQEKPLPMLRLPNVVAPRALGMTIGHEMALIEHSHFFMGSLPAPCEIAIFSPVHYALFNCTAADYTRFGIHFGAARLPFASSSQILVQGKETAELLTGALLDRLRSHKAASGSIHRFIISEQQENRELDIIFQAQVRDLFLKYEMGQLGKVAAEIQQIEETFPSAALRNPSYQLLKDLIECDSPTEKEPGLRDKLVTKLVKNLYPRKLTFGGGGVQSTPVSAGLGTDGWCSRETTIRLGSSNEGDSLILEWHFTATREPMGVLITIDGKLAFEGILPEGNSISEVPITKDNLRTDITIQFDNASAISQTDTRVVSALIKSITIESRSFVDSLYPKSIALKNGIITQFIPDTVGLRRNGWCSPKTIIFLGPSTSGSNLIVSLRAATPVNSNGVLIEVDKERPIKAVVNGDRSITVVPLESNHSRTAVYLSFDSAFYLEHDKTLATSVLEKIEIIDPLAPMAK